MPPRDGSSKRIWLVAGAAGLIGALVAGVLGGALGVRLGAAETGTTHAFLNSAPAPRATPTSLADVARVVLPSVVTVRVTTAGGTALGSGFVVSADGHVLTNDHVVAGGSGIATVVFDDGSVASAKLIGTDPESDVAVLQVQSHPGLTVAELGDSDAVSVGDQVVAVGSPLALRGTVTAGIVSAVDRPIATGTANGDTRYYAAIQTDAAVNHGNSGGPLVDMAGRVVGINAVIKSLSDSEENAGNIGLAFAIPINHASRVAQELITSGRAHRTVIGAELEDTYRASAAGGVRLKQVVPTGPAAAAGLEAGDTVMSVNGHPLGEPNDLIALVRKTAPGDTLKLAYKRGSTSYNADVRVVADAD